jgi:hypothetical protein
MQSSYPFAAVPGFHTVVTRQAAELVIEKTALPRDIDPDILAALLHRAATRYGLHALHSHPWRMEAALFRDIERAAKRLLSLLKNPLLRSALPGPEPGGDGRQLLERLRSDLELLAKPMKGSIERVEAGAAAIGERIAQQNGRHRAKLERMPDADNELVGGDLHLIYEALFEKARKGEAGRAEGNEHARNRFISAACEALGLPPRSDSAIDKARQRYRKRPRSTVWDLLPVSLRIRGMEVWVALPPGRGEKLEDMQQAEKLPGPEE